MMRTRSLAFAFAGALAAFSFHASMALAQAADALTGQVSSEREGALEGVVVSARKADSIVTVSVVTDQDGRYRFPADRLEPGAYALTIRAVGYDLDGKATAQVEAGKAVTADLKLKPARNLPAQLSNAEWFVSMPGTDAQKKALLNCIGCHDIDRIVRSTHDADEFMQIFDRMAGYYPGSTPENPQRLIGDARRNIGQGPGLRAMAEYLASVNLSNDDTWTYKLQPLPRPKGRATHVIITEYDLPRKKIQPHDVVLDAQGQVWFTHFAEQFLGRFDPKTLKVYEYTLPVIKEGYPIGTLDLETEKFETWAVPKEWQTDATQQAFMTPVSAHVDGKVWVKNSDRAQILRLDPATGKWENLGSFKDPVTGKTITSYGIPADAQNNLYLLDFASSNVGRLDAKTG